MGTAGAGGQGRETGADLDAAESLRRAAAKQLSWFHQGSLGIPTLVEYC